MRYTNGVKKQEKSGFWQSDFREEDVSSIVKKLIGQLKPGDVLALSGPLASGKTTLTREIARQLGYRGRVTSPTFVLERQYPLEKGRFKQINHFDFYRLGKNDLASFDWQEALERKDNLTIIEWPEVVKSLLPASIKDISLEIINAKTRKITSRDFTN